MFTSITVKQMFKLCTLRILKIDGYYSYRFLDFNIYRVQGIYLCLK